MRHCYICDDCLRDAGECEITELSVETYNYLCSVLYFESKKDVADIACVRCDGTNIRKLLTSPTSYIKGYGYLDKTGATNDRDLYLMINDKDPYESSRKPGDKQEIVRKLRKNKEHNPKTKVVRMSPNVKKASI